mgnify:CR=1 FL=1|jgi:predicted transcriptional regulator
MEPAHEQLRDSLTNLHRQLTELDVPGEDVRELIVQVKGDVDRILSQHSHDENHLEHANGLSDRLNEAIHRFEDTHPRLTQCLSGIIDVLGQMGI